MKAALLRILTRLLGLSKDYIAFLMPILQDSAARLISQLAPIALEVVKSLADSPHSGAMKREAAIRQVQSLAVSEGIRASSSAVNAAIEIAVLNLKK
jgi:hypothetical protein